MERNWLDWCRLCASDEASINVRHKDVYMRVISKCFDVEIGVEEPALGGMLCNDCYALIGELITFVDNVNKVQPIFELLRHIDQHDQVDVMALRQQYGLPNNRSCTYRYKIEPIELEPINSREASVASETTVLEDQYNNLEDNISLLSAQTQTQTPTPTSTPTPIKRKRGRPRRTDTSANVTPNNITLLPETSSTKRKRGRPKGSTKKTIPVEEDHIVDIEELSENEYKNERSGESFEERAEEELEENHIWLEDIHMEDSNEKIETKSIKRKRGRPRLKKPDEAIVSYDEFDVLSPSNNSKTVEEEEFYEECLEKPESEADEIYNPPLQKRKRGRPRKTEILDRQLQNSNAPAKFSQCKNVALARLLASPEPPEIAESLSYSDASSSNIRRSVSCKICHKILTSESGLRQHHERVHMKKKTVICDICGKRVNNSSELKEHMLVHTEDRPFACPVCNASFKNRKRLNIHSQTHGVPKYECDTCGKKLQTRAIWNKHKYVHTNERRFKCTICGTATKHSTALKVHLLSHTGFRPYACKYCNKAFASGANCRDHKLKKHPLEFAIDDDKSSRLQSVPTLYELRAMAEGMEKGERLRKPRSKV